MDGAPFMLPWMEWGNLLVPIAPWGFGRNISYCLTTVQLLEPSSQPRCLALRQSSSQICNQVKTSRPRSAEFAASNPERSFDFQPILGSFTYSMTQGLRIRRYGRGARTTLMAMAKTHDK